MTIRETLLNALQSDWNLAGIKKVWKYLPALDKIPDSSFPSIHIAYGTEAKVSTPEDSKLYELPVLLIVFFSAKTDSNNQGLLVIEAEKWIENFKKLNAEDHPTLAAVKNFISLEYLTGTPYLNTGVENKGFLLLEHKLTYMGD